MRPAVSDDHWYFVRLPLKAPARCEVVGWAAKAVRTEPFRVAQALGNLRWPNIAWADDLPRWENGAALASFLLDFGQLPVLYGYTRYPLAELQAVPVPSGWRDDPFHWAQASATRLADLLQQPRDLHIVTTVAPVQRVNVKGYRRYRQKREIHIGATVPGQSEAATLGVWLAQRWREDHGMAGELLPDSCRVLAYEAVTCLREGAIPFKPTKISALLVPGTPEDTASRLARGIGRYRSFGLGCVYAEAWL